VYWSKILKKEGKRDPKMEADEAAKQKLQGEWKFYAKVPRDKREAVNKEEPFHVTAPKSVFVNDSVLRVLLFSSGPSRDYQFVRTLLAREVDAKKAQLSIYLQTAKGLDDVNQDVDGSRLLHDFPNKLERGKAGKDGKGKDDPAKVGDPMNLKSYDVIIAFDPDWKELTPLQKSLLKEWVEGDHGGGLIFVSGPQHTQQLIPPPDQVKFEQWPLKPIFALYPVILARPPAGIKAESYHDSTIPYILNFTGIAKGYDFIRLDDDSLQATGGWPEFFGKFVTEEFPGNLQKTHPERGFYSYNSVKKSKDGAEVLATFGDPKARKTEDTPPKDQPFFVTFRVGKGKTFYIGSGELWRLRTFKEEYHQRFWVKLGRFVSSGSGAKSLGRFSMAGEYVTGMIQVEAELRDKDGFPLSPDIIQIGEIHRMQGGNLKDEKPITVEMKAKKGSGKWQGLFGGQTRIDQEGSYEIRTRIPGTDEWITQTFDVKSPNVEMADLRTNHPKLFNMATDAPPTMLTKLDAETRTRLESNRDRPAGGADVKVDIGTGARLFFKLNNAQSISQCIVKVPPERESIKGAFRDLWDRGPEVFEAKDWGELPGLLAAMFGIPFVLFTIVIVLMVLAGRPWAAAATAGVSAAVELLLVVLLLTVPPNMLFRPSLYGVLLVVPPLIALIAVGILLIAERYTWSIAVLAATGLYLVVILAVQMFASPDWPSLKVDFTWVLILIGFLLSREWFTRKMRRLA